MYLIVAGRSLGMGVHPLVREQVAIALFLLAAAVFLFADQQSTPLILWDESRNVMNALEMRRSGFSLVTTYGFEPDHWNTKPPLLIWLMYGSMALFGPSEWAQRLPSALASLGTLLILILFLRRVTGSLGTGLAAGAILLASRGFFSEHGALTADYDALLLFFTTAYLQLLFFALHQRRPAVKLSLLIGALVACAFLTKSTAGLVAGAGIPFYLAATRRWRRPFAAWPAYVCMAAAAILPVILFLAAREAMAPGYWEATLFNDVLGRFQHTLIGRTTRPTLYLETLLSGWFFAGPLLLLIPFALRRLRGRKRALFLFSLVVGCGQLAVCSLSATRLAHYILPALPWFAACVAVMIPALWAHHIAPSLRRGGRPANSPAVAIAGALTLVMGDVAFRNLDWRFRELAETRFSPEAQYGALFSALSRSGVSSADVVDPGFPLDGRPHYSPLLDSYRLIWAEQGLAVRHVPDVPRSGDTLLATCSAAVVPLLLRNGPNLTGVPGCAAVRRSATLAR